MRALYHHVLYEKTTGRFCVRATVRGSKIPLGTYATMDEAARVWDNYAYYAQFNIILYPLPEDIWPERSNRRLKLNFPADYDVRCHAEESWRVPEETQNTRRAIQEAQIIEEEWQHPAAQHARFLQREIKQELKPL